MKEFNNKSDCEVYIPIETSDDETFLVELLELCECYLEPLKYGVCKEEIVELFEYEKRGGSLIEFLKLKRYVSDDISFFNLAKKYMVKPDCLKLCFKNIKYDDVEYYFGIHSISEIRNKNIDSSIKQIGRINKNGEFVNYQI